MREKPNNKYIIRVDCPWAHSEDLCEYCGGTGVVSVLCPIGGTDRNQKIAEEYKRLSSVVKVGKLFDLSGTRVHQILRREYPELLNCN